MEKGLPRHAHPSTDPAPAQQGWASKPAALRGPADEPGLVPRRGSPAWHPLQPGSPCQALPPWQAAASFWLLSGLRIPESIQAAGRAGAAAPGAPLAKGP